MAFIFHKIIWWFSFSFMLGMHPFYVGVVEVELNENTRNWEVAVKIFTDDLENAIALEAGTKPDLFYPASDGSTDTLVARYLRKHLVLHADGKKIPLKYLGFEREKEAVWTYLEAPSIARPKTVDCYTDLLYNLTKDQINLIHITVHKERKSGKLDHPTAKFSAVFP